jgi:hypothetical protein
MPSIVLPSTKSQRLLLLSAIQPYAYSHLAIAPTSWQADNGEQVKLNGVQHGQAGEQFPRI